MRIYAIVGIGGHGRETMPLAEEMLNQFHMEDDYRLVFVDDNNSSPYTNGHDILAPEDFLALDAEKFFNVAIADSHCRERLAEKLTGGGAQPFTVRASNSGALSSSHISPGAILSPYSLITANATIGKFFHANMYAYVAHDCEIGDFVTFAPRVCCNGGVVVEDHVYIGTGAVIRQSMKGRRIVIGEGAFIGMGAVVTKSVPPYTTVVGNPARPLRPTPATRRANGNATGKVTALPTILSRLHR
ncbi:acetyltransferase [Allopusillimonas ginsengisoli]|uniref:PglD-related sugar-binding protein n=1 Tax=Allopusillimonas ginsengisoli TaxID=453575 RepID=UPI00143028AA|nr:acetyltransferase [Allopusillimonas ginsengisoli]